MINGSQSINISGITCGPGHGISIGSLGKIQNEVVTDVHVKNCTLIATQNGARIKTWAPSESGSATSINFEDIFMDNVRNPIIIDQHYCSSPPCSSQVLALSFSPSLNLTCLVCRKSCSIKNSLTEIIFRNNIYMSFVDKHEALSKIFTY